MSHAHSPLGGWGGLALYPMHLAPLTNPNYVYILLIVKEHLRQPSVAQLAEIAETCACLNIRKAARAVTQRCDEVLQQ